MNKEKTYDTEISPLMQQVINICREEGIAMIASFAIGHEDGGPNGEDATNLTVTTHLPDDEGQFDPRFNKSAVIIRDGARLRGVGMQITTSNPDGTKTLTAII
ncbi:hypothetical protein [Pseudomonas sp.]|uniref:hypothetical protein n=1 Tax=Pseudomonas sp. TaxID=306 RepID=UPI00289CBFB2|nr:hypothetical protein [Pseudomonas sp.]